MSTSIYYRAVRSTPLTRFEEERVAEVVNRCNESFPFDYEELCFYCSGDGDAEEVLNGSTKISPEPDEMMTSIAHWCHALTDLRRVLPDAEWTVHLDDIDIEWSEGRGYSLPGMGEELDDR